FLEARRLQRQRGGVFDGSAALSLLAFGRRGGGFATGRLGRQRHFGARQLRARGGDLAVDAPLVVFVDVDDVGLRREVGQKRRAAGARRHGRDDHELRFFPRRRYGSAPQRVERKRSVHRPQRADHAGMDQRRVDDAGGDDAGSVAAFFAGAFFNRRGDALFFVAVVEVQLGRGRPR